MAGAHPSLGTRQGSPQEGGRREPATLSLGCTGKQEEEEVELGQDGRGQNLQLTVCRSRQWRVSVQQSGRAKTQAHMQILPGPKLKDPRLLDLRSACSLPS